VDQIIHSLDKLANSNHSSVAVSSVVFIYDYLLTLDTEVEQIWKAPWTTLKVAYLLQRYLPFLDTVFLSIVREQLSALACRMVILTDNKMVLPQI
jgi:hypothetical protein